MRLLRGLQKNWDFPMIFRKVVQKSRRVPDPLPELKATEPKEFNELILKFSGEFFSLSSADQVVDVALVLENLASKILSNVEVLEDCSEVPLRVTAECEVSVEGETVFGGRRPIVRASRIGSDNSSSHAPVPVPLT
ncbi:hypothetical protein J6590_037790 [Homalodisca vitripennis]|nr:hypothetical protein J6590_037790 [Homalodisca vitripennis]